MRRFRNCGWRVALGSWGGRGEDGIIVSREVSGEGRDEIKRAGPNSTPNVLERLYRMCIQNAVGQTYHVYVVIRYFKVRYLV